MKCLDCNKIMSQEDGYCHSCFSKELETQPAWNKRNAKHEMDCYIVGGRKDCPLKGNGTNPDYFAGCYLT